MSYLINKVLLKTIIKHGSYWKKRKIKSVGDIFELVIACEWMICIYENFKEALSWGWTPLVTFITDK